MIRSNKVASAVGAVGAVIALGHVVLGPTVVPVVAANFGAVLVVAAGLVVLVARRRGLDRDDQRSPGGPG
jgi:hypothetical protein